LLELAALLQIGAWEHLGMLEHLPVELPTFAQAASHLGQRLRNGPAEFSGPVATPLHLQVLQAWVENFAWEGREIFGADFVLGTV